MRVCCCSAGLILCLQCAVFDVYTKDDGSLWGAGEGTHGQFSNGLSSRQDVPVQIESSGVTKIISLGTCLIYGYGSFNPNSLPDSPHNEGTNY